MFSPNELLSVSIEPNNIYKLHSYWIGSYEFKSQTKKQFSKIEDYRDIYGNGLENDKFIKINKNRKLSFYLKPRNDEINCESFEKNNPNSIGIYDIHNEIIHTKRALWIGHSKKLIRGKALIKKDTIHLMEKLSNFTKHYQYVKVNCE